MENNLKFGYWKLRGLGHMVKTVIEYVKAPYTIIDYTNQWFQEKFNLGLKFPNLPYLIDGDQNYTETVAIIRYICSKYDPSLLGKTLADQGEVDMTLQVLHNINYNSLAGPCYENPDKAAIAKGGLEAYKPIVNHLGNKQFLVGNYVTAPDLYNVEVLDRLLWLTDNQLFAHYPTLKGYYDRLNNIPQIIAWKNSNRWLAGPFNGPSALVNNYSSRQVTDKFFEACEKGQGWAVCKEYCSENAKFSCDVLPQTNIQDYTNWMKGLIETIAPDGRYELLSVSEDKNKFIYCAKFIGTHTLNGGPVPPSNPPKKTECDYVYIIYLDQNNKIVEMKKIWDQLTAFKQWGWPIADKN